MVTRLDQKGWVFTYIGANQDAMIEAYKLGIKNSLNFQADAEGTKKMWEKENSSRMVFFEEASRNDISDNSLKENYFNKDNLDGRR